MSARWVVHTLDSLRARCDEVGQCWIWKGATSGKGGKPSMRRNGKTVQPRRVARELADGKPVPDHLECACTCGDKMCISPHCSVVVTHKTRAQMAAERGAFTNPERSMRIAMRMRANSRFSDELIAYIRSAPGPVKRIVQETGMSQSYVTAIRRGEQRRDFSNPFAGLGA